MRRGNCVLSAKLRECALSARCVYYHVAKSHSIRPWVFSLFHRFVFVLAPTYCEYAGIKCTLWLLYLCRKRKKGTLFAPLLNCNRSFGRSAHFEYVLSRGNAFFSLPFHSYLHDGVRIISFFWNFCIFQPIALFKLAIIDKGALRSSESAYLSFSLLPPFLFLSFRASTICRKMLEKYSFNNIM